MPNATFHFPPDFQWGTATSSHQVEGNNTNNDWWAWEQEKGHIAKGHKSGLACDWWNRAEEDFDRAAEMGQNAHRLSIEWSRVEPEEGHFDDAALERYREMLQSLRERGIEPMVTLHHFTNPLWLVERGGWETKAVIPLFEQYVGRVVEALGEWCDLWCVLNEPNVYAAQGYVLGQWPPGKFDFRLAMRVLRHFLEAHAAAYRRIHELQPDARVGIAHAMQIFDPADLGSALDRRVAGWQDRIFNDAILTALTKGRWTVPLGFGRAPGLRGTLDWIGLNYYTRNLVAFDRTRPRELFGCRFHADDAEMSDGGYSEVYPEGLLRLLRRLSRYDLPLYVTENGIPDDDDDQRPRFILTHLHQLWHAIQHCYPVMGYYHWTLVDNFEWAWGWTIRFGLIELKPYTQSRYPRKSAKLYEEICKANAITPAVIDRYAPELRPVLLPG